ncbi:MAG: dockerin type I domain-containing protein, partial [Candidatus Zixiibacteriota bacterium]
TSRYRDFTNKNYQFGFLGFAVNQSITVNDGQICSDTVAWNVGSFGAVSQSNIAAIAVVSNTEGHAAFSSPSDQQFPFTAHWVDAAAISYPGVLKVDDPTGSYTHTVFLEEATQSSCSACPVTRAALEAIHAGGNYQFIYAAMLFDNAAASNYLFGNYNTGYTPTVYFDGGQGVFVGGSSNQSNYTSRILSASTRPVLPVKLAVKLNFISATQLTVEYIVKSANEAPALPDPPTGLTEVRAGTTQQYSATALDLDGDAVLYRWIYDKGDTSAWMGPYANGVACTINHSWPASGSYDISVIAKDYWDECASASTPITITVFTCGDSDNTGIVTISDAVFLINYIFAGGPAPSPEIAADADCTGITTISDAVYLINYIFAGGPQPCESSQ